MTISIPIIVLEKPAAESGLPSFLVRPLFAPEPIERADKLSRALTKLSTSLYEQLQSIGREPRHDDLLGWTFNPPLEDATVDLRLELQSGSHRCHVFLVGYAALGRKLFFTPSLPRLHFELHPGQILKERAAEVLNSHLRQFERKREEPIDINSVALTGKASLTAIELNLKPSARAVKPKQSFRAMLFGGNTEKPDGADELRKTSRPLHSLFPDDLERALERDQEVEELLRLLNATDRRPILLVGPRKVGKSAVVQEAVWRMCSRKKGDPLKKREFWLVSPMRLISGMSFLGQWENRVIAILDYAAGMDRILYFDDLLGLFTAGVSSASDLNVAQVLKPALERHRVRVVAEITPEAWRVLRERDRAFADLFHVVPIVEQSEAQTIQVLVNVTRQLEEQHRCHFDLPVIPRVLDLCRRFGSDAAFPGKAAGFLRRLAVRAEGSAISEDGAIAEFHEQTGLHLALLNDHFEINRQSAMEMLKRRVSGQDHALERFAEVFLKLKARLNDPRRPLGTFLLLGPTGVGKTQAAKSVAATLFGSADRLLRFDMNEYVDPLSAARLAGTPRQPEGLLTSAIRRQPFSVVLFDEIEKAAPEVYDLLLAVLDEGRLTDALGRVADFTQAIIILTSNLGAREAQGRLGFRTGDAAEDNSVYLSAAEKFFRPEFFNRLDAVIPFHALTREHLEAITRALLQDLFSRDGLRRRECLLNVSDAAMARLVDLGHHPQLGARALKRVIEREVAQPLAERLTVVAPGVPLLANLNLVENAFALRLDELRPAERIATWTEKVSATRKPADQRHWTDQVLEGVEAFLDRAEPLVESAASSGPIELGHVRPEQARYFFCREQLNKVQRILHAAGRASNSVPSRAGARVPKPRPSKLVIRQYVGDPTPQFDRLREAASLRSELADLDAADPVEVPDSPTAALLREAALLEAMLAAPADDRPLFIQLHAHTAPGALPLCALADAYQQSVSGLWGANAEFLLPRRVPAQCIFSAGKPDLQVQGLWCTGLNLRRVLPVGVHTVLGRDSNGALHFITLSILEVESAGTARSLLKQLIANRAEQEEISFGRLLHVFDGSKTLADLRTGVVVPAEPSAEEFRALLLSALPLPPEIVL